MNNNESVTISECVAVQFVIDKLKVQDLKEKLHGDKLARLDLLNELIEAFQKTVPWQNISMLQNWPDKIRVPTMEEIVNNCLNLTGGTCYTLNVFFWMLLKALGFDVTLSYCTLTTMKLTRIAMHAICLVTNIEDKSDNYMVDVGLYFPTLQAIPLHEIHDGEGIDYQDAFINYRIEKRGDHYYRRQKVDKVLFSSPIPGVSCIAHYYWLDFHFTNCEPINVHSLLLKGNEMHSDPEYTLYKYIWISSHSHEFTLMVRNFSVFIWTERNKNLVEIKCHGRPELAKTIAQYFPTIAHLNVDEAIDNWLVKNSERTLLHS